MSDNKCFYFKIDNQDTGLTCQSLSECDQNIADILGPEAINGISGGIDTFAKGSFHPFSSFISLEVYTIVCKHLNHVFYCFILIFIYM